MLTPEQLGRVVRLAWITWARHQPDPRSSWLLTYDELPPEQKEVDNQIGIAVLSVVLQDLEQHGYLVFQ